MELSGATVLVTGAGGFIPSHLAERLVKEGCRVRAMLHYDARAHRGNLEYADPALVRQMEVIAGDVQDPHFMMEAVKGCSVVFHLAALIAIPYSYVAPASYVQTNVMGTLNVLQACRAHGVARVVHTSTSECYGTARYEPIDEKHPLQGQSPYSASKIGADKIAESFFLSYETPVVTLRPFNTYGPRQSARAVIPTILSQLLSGEPTLKLGSLDTVRDFNFVEDTAEGFVAAAKCDAAVGETVNVGSGKKITIGQLAELAMEATGRRVPIVTEAQRLRPAKSEVGLLLCDYGKAKSLMGWTPKVDFLAGLKRTADFVAAHPELFRAKEFTR
jgi:NAD dependent epimerase/dehydratase